MRRSNLDPRLFCTLNLLTATALRKTTPLVERLQGRGEAREGDQVDKRRNGADLRGFVCAVAGQGYPDRRAKGGYHPHQTTYVPLQVRVRSCGWRGDLAAQSLGSIYVDTVMCCMISRA